jgi:hypothetical protein
LISKFYGSPYGSSWVARRKKSNFSWVSDDSKHGTTNEILGDWDSEAGDQVHGLGIHDNAKLSVAYARSKKTPTTRKRDHMSHDDNDDHKRTSKNDHNLAHNHHKAQEPDWSQRRLHDQGPRDQT